MQYTTPKGVAFDDIRQHLPDRVSEWPEIVPVLNKPHLRHKYLEEMKREGRRCPLCSPENRRPVSEVHHIVGGSKGRPDERTNFLAVCSTCHREVQSQRSEYRRVWLAKWVQDAPHVDWVRLVLLFGRWPEFDSLD